MQHIQQIIIFIVIFGITAIPAHSQWFVGGEDAVFDPDLFDPAYPMMKEWAKAGVEGGIPHRENLKVCLEITPQDDINQVLQKVSGMGGVLLLKEGTYTIKESVNIPSNVVLRGVDKEKVILSVKMHGNFSMYRVVTTAALCLNNVTGAGIEDVTIKYDAVDFQPLDKQHIYDLWEKAIFHEKETRDTTLFVVSVWFEKAKNCWIDNCNILCSGDDPIRITNSSHITCRKNYIDRCYNKCDGGMGYYNIINSSYILSCYEEVKRIRHFAIHIDSKYCVAIHNHFEVDVNFHSGDKGYNLVENNRVMIPVWHSWHCFQLGSPREHQPAGEWNVLYNNQAYYKLTGSEFSEKDVVYLMNTEFQGGIVRKTDLSSPAGGTFYPVSVRKNLD